MGQTCKPAKSPRHVAKQEEPIDRLLNAELFKRQGDPTPPLLLASLAKCVRACSLSEVAECCSVEFLVVSRHLALLGRAGVVDSSKTGRVVSCQARYKEVSQALKDLAAALDDCCGRADRENSCKC